MGIAYFLAKRDAHDAVMVGLLVPTHWVLDFIAHRPDMPIYPGSAKFGLGLWHSLPLTIVVECGLFAAGLRFIVVALAHSIGLGIWRCGRFWACSLYFISVPFSARRHLMSGRSP